VTIIPSSNEEYAVQGYMFDITQQKQAEVRVQQLVNYDVLTNLPNRNLLTDRLQQAINLALRQKHFCALLYIDLGRFKNINDSLGYSVGDLLLQEVAAKIQNMMRAADTVARLGGDEFAVLLNDIGGKKEHAASHARMLAAKVLEEIAVPHTIDEQELHISANIGIAVFPEENDTAGDILRHAHTAMNKTKNDGQEDIQFFLPNMQAAALERMELERGLRNALSLGEMSLHYQPIVQVDTNQIIGSEVLLRWKRDDGTMVEPSVFIPIAEETGDIFPIGDWVMRQAARQYVDWQKSGMDISNMFLSVNVCPRQFHQQDFVEKVIQALEETGLSPSTLKLEITEGMILSDIEDTSRKIDRLKSLGISFAIDDFGTGYSSLSYLKELSLDALKIDKSFIRDAENTPDDLVIIETIISMANHLGLDVIAEGVETETSLQFLREKQCHSYQGYHFSRPVPAEIFAELI
jgi:diguanylate cyclase (GGDEF)-like protein